MKKLIFALIVVAALLVVAMPVAAQGPNPYGVPYLPNPYLNLQNPAPWYNRTGEMNAQWAGDPFGGNPRLGVEVTYVPDGKGGVVQKIANAAWPYTGIVAKFGATPWIQYDALPGGIPSSMSGDGSAPRKAIYIGGAWADQAVDPAAKFGSFNGPVQLPQRGANENPFELPACATVKIPAAGSKWFKLDTWKNEARGSDVNKIATQIWLDDELDGATKPSGSAVFGAANKYMYGTAPNDYWSKGAFFYSSQQSGLSDYKAADGTPLLGGPIGGPGKGYLHGQGLEGFVMVVYGPDVLQPNYAFAAPNAWLYSLGVSGSGGVQRSCTAAAFAGQACVTAPSGGNSLPGGNSLSQTHLSFSTEVKRMCEANKGNVCDNPLGNGGVSTYGEYNINQPSHLLFSEGTYDGWVHVRVVNQMIWDGTATVCSYRNVTAARARN